RFFDAPKIDLVNGRDVLTQLTPGGAAAEFVDDAGSHVFISVTGGTGGTVRVLPIDGSQGVAIGQISVDLTGGTILNIHGTNQTEGGALGIPAVAGTTVSIQFGAGVFRPATDDDFTRFTAFLDDIGSPIDGQLNGLVLRTGGLTEARIDGSVGDLILEDNTAA